MCILDTLNARIPIVQIMYNHGIHGLSSIVVLQVSIRQSNHS